MGFFDRLRQRDEGTIKAERLSADDDAAELDEFEDEDFEKEAPADREGSGPFDAAEAPEGNYIDFGAIRIPAEEGMAIRVEFHQQTRAVVAVAIDLDGSTLQVQPFAAPRSSGLWREVRGQLTESLSAQGATTSTTETEVGTALVATMAASEGAKQRTIKFLGVDGPRWFVRGVVSGPAARDEDLLAPLMKVFRGLIVVRGEQAAPPRDLLPMVMPDALAQQMQARAQAGAKDA